MIWDSCLTLQCIILRGETTEPRHAAPSCREERVLQLCLCDLGRRVGGDAGKCGVPGGRGKDVRKYAVSRPVLASCVGMCTQVEQRGLTAAGGTYKTTTCLIAITAPALNVKRSRCSSPPIELALVQKVTFSNISNHRGCQPRCKVMDRTVEDLPKEFL